MGFDASIPGSGSMFPVLGGPADLAKDQPDALHQAIKPPPSPPTPLAEIPEVTGSSLAPRPSSLSNLEQNRFSPELVNRHIALGGEFEKFASAAEKQATSLISGDVAGLAELEHAYLQAVEVHGKFPSLGDRSARVARQERLDKIYHSFSALRSNEDHRFSSDKVQKHIDLNSQFEVVLSSAEEKMAIIGDNPSTAQLAELVQAHRQGLELHRQFPSLGDHEAQLQRMERLDFISAAISGIDIPQMVAIESHLNGQQPESTKELSDLTRFAMADDPTPQAPIKETTVKVSSPKTEPMIASKKPAKTPALVQVSQGHKDTIKKEWEAIQGKVAKYRTLDPQSSKAGKLKAEIKDAYDQLKLFDTVYKTGTVSLVLKSLGFHETQVLASASLDLRAPVDGTEVASLNQEVQDKVKKHKNQGV